MKKSVYQLTLEKIDYDIEVLQAARARLVAAEAKAATPKPRKPRSIKGVEQTKAS